MESERERGDKARQGSLIIAGEVADLLQGGIPVVSITKRIFFLADKFQEVKWDKTAFDRLTKDLARRRDKAGFDLDVPSQRTAFVESFGEFIRAML